MAAQRSTEGLVARLLAVIAMLGVAVGVAVLVASAYGHTAQTRPAGTVAPVPAFTLGVKPPTPSALPTADPRSSDMLDPAPVPTTKPAGPRDAERFLAAGSGAGSNVWWRAVAGECGRAQPFVERSIDQGATWTDVSPLSNGATQIASLDAFEQVQAELVVGTGPSCEPQALRTYTEGEFWESYPNVLALSRFIQFRDPSFVASPVGPIAAPCTDGRSLRARGALVAIVCDGLAYVAREGATWVQLPATEVSSLSISGDGVMVAHVEDGCDGIALTRYAAGDPAQPGPSDCAQSADGSQATAIADSAAGTLVWSGDSVLVVP